jgi:hypothetical protein
MKRPEEEQRGLDFEGRWQQVGNVDSTRLQRMIGICGVVMRNQVARVIMSSSISCLGIACSGKGGECLHSGLYRHPDKSNRGTTY